MGSALAQCPFCGSSEKVQNAPRTGRGRQSYCLNCAAEGPAPHLVGCKDGDEAWNKRAFVELGVTQYLAIQKLLRRTVTPNAWKSLGLPDGDWDVLVGLLDSIPAAPAASDDKQEEMNL